MRFIKRQSLDRRTANNATLYSDAGRNNVYVSPFGAGSLVVPVGTVAQRDAAIATPTTGMIRYSSDASTGGELQVYQGGASGAGGRWRNVRFKEQGGILQQNLGAGDGNTTVFGPLNSTYYNPLNNNASNVTVGGQNIFVIIENVIQVSSINYTISALNPSVTGATYTPTTSTATAIGATTMYFNTALVATGISGSSGTVTMTFTAQPANPFAVGSTIVVTGFVPLAYNGSFTVTACTTTQVQWSNATTAVMTIAGQGASSQAVYPSISLIGATVTGSASFQASTLVTAYATDPITDALVSITFTGKPTQTSIIAVNTGITITEATTTGSGYYLQFTAPVPLGKVVIALLGFDQ